MGSFPKWGHRHIQILPSTSSHGVSYSTFLYQFSEFLGDRQESIRDFDDVHRKSAISLPLRGPHLNRRLSMPSVSDAVFLKILFLQFANYKEPVVSTLPQNIVQPASASNFPIG
jgi:hypothetical protein